MCLIIKKLPGRQITADFLAHVWEHNSHGWGSFYSLGGKVFSTKGMQFEDLLSHVDDLPDDVEVYLHLRKATYGHVNEAMAHPYEVRDSLMLMHNGTIHHMCPSDPRYSDTAELAGALRCMLDGLTESQATAMLRSPGFARVTAPLVEGSMVVLHDRTGAVRLGRGWHVMQASEWDEAMAGVEVSNTHAWRPRNRVVAGSPWQRATQRIAERWKQVAARPVGAWVGPTRY